MKYVALFLFMAFSLGELGAIIYDNPSIHHYCKPMLMVTLLFYYYIASKENRSLLLVGALVAAGVGDVLLMLAESDERFFIPGLGAFLFTHVLMILTFRQHRSEHAENPLRGVQSIRMAFPVVLAGTGLIIMLYPTLGTLQLPVTLYSIVLMMMVLSALYRYGYTMFKSMMLTFAGALLFMMSDSILAVDKFLFPIDHAARWTMLTYIAGQFFIVKGLLSHKIS
jgi:uncharacterized membrane protein YhhN